MRKILITGGSGFIGTNLVELYKETDEVLNIDIAKPRNKNHYEYWLNIDILQKGEFEKAVFKFQPEVVFHMAAKTDLNGKTIEAYKANTAGVKNVIDVLSNIESVKKIIFASSRLVCEIGYQPKNEFDYKPSTIYGESKIIGEKLVRESKLLNKDWLIVRPTSLWGPWFDIPYKNFFDLIFKNLYFHPKNKKINKKFGFVLNSVYILDKLMFSNHLLYKTIYLSDFKNLELKNWANLISNHFHQKNVKEIPYPFLKFLSFLGNLSKKIGYKNPPLTTFRLSNLTTNMLYETHEVEHVIGKLPYTLEESTNITCKWFLQQKDIKI